MSACESSEISPLAGSASADASIEALVILMARHLILGADVAATKFVRDGQIDDPAREKELLEWAGGMRGRRRQTGAAFFADQIVASEVVQRGLHCYWRRSPEGFPKRSRGPTEEIQPQLDALSKEILSLLPSVPPQSRDQSAAAHALLECLLAASLPLRPLAGIRRAAAHIALQSLIDDG